MAWILAEALIALIVLVGIMAWTMRMRRPDEPVDEPAGRADAEASPAPRDPH